MNRFITQVWLYVILAAIITSCSPVSRREKDNLQKIDEAWDMSDHNLDSSIILFQNIQNSVYRSTEYVRMKYDLLGIRLRDKSYMVPTSADSIKRITEFMEKHGSKKDCMRAYYYMGTTYDDLNDSPRAVESTLKAFIQRRRTILRHCHRHQMLFTLIRHLQKAVQLTGVHTHGNGRPGTCQRSRNGNKLAHYGCCHLIRHGRR